MYDLADGYDSWLDRLDALQDERTEPEPTPPAVTRGRAYVRPADDKARLATSIRDASRRYPHRSHRHQAGEE